MVSINVTGGTFDTVDGQTSSQGTAAVEGDNAVPTFILNPANTVTCFDPETGRVSYVATADGYRSEYEYIYSRVTFIGVVVTITHDDPEEGIVGFFEVHYDVNGYITKIIDLRTNTEYIYHLGLLIYAVYIRLKIRCRIKACKAFYVIYVYVVDFRD